MGGFDGITALRTLAIIAVSQAAQGLLHAFEGFRRSPVVHGGQVKQEFMFLNSQSLFDMFEIHNLVFLGRGDGFVAVTRVTLIIAEEA
jgi:hypothetical protein